jgi:hypothetical protein
VGILPPPEDVTIRGSRESLRTLDREGPQTEQGTSNVSTDNVVRLPPRDWLGSREDLVPLGAGPHEPESTPEETAQVRHPLPDGSLVTPPSAADFWGERAETIHDAIQTPIPAETASQSAPGPTAISGAGGARARRHIRGASWSGRLAIPWSPAVPGPIRQLADRQHVRSRNLAAVVGALATATVAVWLLNDQGTPTSSHSRNSAGIHGVGLLGGARIAMLPALPVEIGSRRAAGQRAHHHESRARASGSAKHRPAKHRAVKPHQHSMPPPAAADSAPPASGSGSGSSGSVAVSTSATPTSSSTAASVAQSGSQASTSTSTPTKAYGPSGALGPGSSNNG